MLCDHKVVAPPAAAPKLHPPQRVPQSAAAPSAAASTTVDPNSMTFTQTTGTITPGADGTTSAHTTCFKCESLGHYANNCPVETGTTMFQVSPTILSVPNGLLFNQHTGSIIPPQWVLLDSQSTVSVFHNPIFLTNIRPSSKKLTVFRNGGTQVSSLEGDLTNFGTVWYNPQSLANILSLAAVRKVCRVTMDSSIEPSISVHRSNGGIMKFFEYGSGLYYHDPFVASLSLTHPPGDFSFVSTVAS